MFYSFEFQQAHKMFSKDWLICLRRTNVRPIVCTDNIIPADCCCKGCCTLPVFTHAVKVVVSVYWNHKPVLPALSYPCRLNIQVLVRIPPGIEKGRIVYSSKRKGHRHSVPIIFELFYNQRNCFYICNGRLYLGIL